MIPTAPALVLRPGRLVDGVADRPHAGWEVAVSGGVIDHVGAVGSFPVEGRVVVDLPELTLLPGLVDAHTHYLLDSTIPRGNSVLTAGDSTDAEMVLTGVRNARTALEAGITTARSAGAPRDLDIPLAVAIRRGDVAGPRLIPAGRAITITGGHGVPFGIVADSIPEMVVAVRTLAEAGVGVVKAVASEAAMLVGGRAGVQELTAEELAAMVAEASRLGLRVLAHAQNPGSVAAAAAAGVASVEHAFLADRPSLEALAASGVALTPTLVVTDVYASIDGLDEATRRRQEQISAAHRWSCETAIELGIPLIAGTDGGLRGVHPDLLWREVWLLADHGLPPMEAIKAATSRAADVLGLPAVGRIVAGSPADLLAVAGDAIADLRRLATPELVVAEGRVVVDTGHRVGRRLDTISQHGKDSSDN